MLGAVVVGRRAVIYTAGDRRTRTELLAWCRRRGYQVTAIADDPGSAKGAVWQGTADVLVIAREQHWRHLGDRVVVMGEQRGPSRPQRLRR